eukprot:scaffold4037_cov237-Pinguiococcus_pyrenoidosus.AAC.1
MRSSGMANQYLNVRSSKQTGYRERPVILWMMWLANRSHQAPSSKLRSEFGHRTLDGGSRMFWISDLTCVFSEFRAACPFTSWLV